MKGRGKREPGEDDKEPRRELDRTGQHAPGPLALAGGGGRQTRIKEGKKGEREGGDARELLSKGPTLFRPSPSLGELCCPKFVDERRVPLRSPTVMYASSRLSVFVFLRMFRRVWSGGRVNCVIECGRRNRDEFCLP